MYTVKSVPVDSEGRKCMPEAWLRSWPRQCERVNKTPKEVLRSVITQDYPDISGIEISPRDILSRSAPTSGGLLIEFEILTMPNRLGTTPYYPTKPYVEKTRTYDVDSTAY